MNRDDITPELLRKILRYNPETGKLFWLKRTADMFESGKLSAQHRCNVWNGNYAGKEAFSINGKGYIDGKIFNISFNAHRVAWALFYGEWPKEQIDHIDGNRTNNKISNLRAVSQAENSKNVKLTEANTSGTVGVYWYKRKNKWCAEIVCDYKKIRLGYFDEIQDAIAARKQAEKKYGFHPNHGRTND